MRILLIEDDERTAHFIKKGLEAERYQVELAADGAEGLEMALSGIYDLMVLDIRLPVLDGTEVCRRVRQAGIEVPLLMLSARDTVEDKVRGLEAGADDYLTKPFAFEELVARTQALLRRRGKLPLERRLQVGDLVLDGNTHEVSRAGRPVTLTAREFALLEYLMRHAGRVLSRPLIEEHVWGYGHDPFTNVVDVYIRRLRKKIDEGHPRRLLHTVRGVGYQIKEP